MNGYCAGGRYVPTKPNFCDQRLMMHIEEAAPVSYHIVLDILATPASAVPCEDRGLLLCTTDHNLGAQLAVFRSNMLSPAIETPLLVSWPAGGQ